MGVRTPQGHNYPWDVRARQRTEPHSETQHATRTTLPEPRFSTLGANPPRGLRPQLRLILPDPTAIGVGLSHGSRAPPGTRGRGERLSNTWLTYPRDGDNPGKLGLIPDRRGGLERSLAERVYGASSRTPPEDGAAAHQVVGGVTARQADNG